MDRKLAYWCSHVSGRLEVTKLSTRTDGLCGDRRCLARVVGAVGFDDALAQGHFFARYRVDKQLEAISTAVALATVTERFKLIRVVVAKVIATAEQSVGSVGSSEPERRGWIQGEVTGSGEPWLDHDNRYRRSVEFIRG